MIVQTPSPRLNLRKSRIKRKITSLNFTPPRKSLNSSHYKTFNLSNPSYKFSELSRFDESIDNKYKSMLYLEINLVLQRYSDKVKKLSNKELNKTVQIFTNTEKTNNIKTLAYKERMKGSINKITQQYIQNTVHEEKNGKLLEKFKRFNLRQNKHVLFQLGKYKNT